MAFGELLAHAALRKATVDAVLSATIPMRVTGTPARLAEVEHDRQPSWSRIAPAADIAVWNTYVKPRLVICVGVAFGQPRQLGPLRHLGHRQG